MSKREGKGWQRRFLDPIPLPDGGKLVTLRDAGNHIAGLPAKVSQQKHWQTAARELLMSAERGGILQLADWAIRAAIWHGVDVKKEPRGKKAKRYRIVR